MVGIPYYDAMQCVAVCCSILQCLLVSCSVLHCAAMCSYVLQCVAVCCSVLQCLAVSCIVLQCVAMCCSVLQQVSEILLKKGHSALLCRHTRISLRPFVQTYTHIRNYWYKSHKSGSHKRAPPFCVESTISLRPFVQNQQLSRPRSLLELGSQPW